MTSRLTMLISLDDARQADLAATVARDHFPASSISIVSKEELPGLLENRDVQIVILDCLFPGGNQAFDTFLDSLSGSSPATQLILIIPENHQDCLRAALEHQVFFFLDSPVQAQELGFVLERAALKCRHLAPGYGSGSRESPRFSGFIGECGVMCRLFELITRIAEDDFSTVLIRGESGTGKELVARAIHSSSRRKDRNFVPVNCAAIPDDLLESELFGHIKGSFTGATQSKQGRIQYADKGTLFLDEIGDMKPGLQAKLLRVLQEKEFEPVGSLKPIPVDTRIVAATHCDLEQQVQEGRFREDLYYRLSVIPVEVPPLRQRCDDIPLLLENFIHTHTVKRGRRKISFSPEAIELLRSYRWRGNVRELENLVQHMAILHGGKQIYPHDLPEKFLAGHNQQSCTPPVPDAPPPAAAFDHSRERAELLAPSPASIPEIDLSNGPVDFNQLINEFEKDLILKAMKLTSGNKKEAARMLNLKRTTLLEKIKKKELSGRW